MANKSNPETKKFSLKPIEQQMLKVFQETYYTNLSNFLSFIALERLSYPVTQNTKYQVDNGELSITEVEPDKPEEVSTVPETK